MKNLIVVVVLSLFAFSSQAQVPRMELEAIKKLQYTQIDSIVLVAEEQYDYATCLYYLEAGQAKAKAEKGEMDSVYADYISNTAYFYQALGDYKTALELYKKTLAISEKIMPESHPFLTTALSNLSATEQLLGHYKIAEAYALRSISLQTQHLGVEHSNTLASLANLAELYKEMGAYYQAEALYLKVNSIISKKGEKETEGYFFNLVNLANLYQEMWSYEKSEAFFVEAKNLYGKIYSTEGPDYAFLLVNFATLYGKTGKYADSESFMLQAKEIIVKFFGKEHPRYANLLNNLAMLYRRMKKNTNAEETYWEAIKIQEKVLGQQHLNYITCLRNIGLLYYENKEYAKAFPILKKTLALNAQSIGVEHPEYALTLRLLADVYHATGALDSALYYCWLSIDASSDQIDSKFYLPNPVDAKIENLDQYNYSSNQNINNSFFRLLLILKAKYDQSKDNIWLEKHSQLVQVAIRLNNRIRNDFSNEEDKLNTLAVTNIFVLQGINTSVLLKKEGFQKESFALAEFNKGILLMDAAKSEKAYQFGNLPDSLVEQEKALQKKFTNLKAQLLQNLPAEQKANLQTKLNEINQEIDAFKRNIKQKYHNYTAIKYDNKGVSATDVQNSLDEKTALIEYVIEDSVLYIFYIDKHKIDLVVNPIEAKDLTNRIKEMHEALSNYTLIANDQEKAYQVYTENALWFYKKLLADVLKNKSINRLIVIPDGELGHLPFETFLVEAAPKESGNYQNLHYLVKDYHISYNYSAALFVTAQNGLKKNRQNNGQIFAMAANYDTQVRSEKEVFRLPVHTRTRHDLALLPAARQEVEALQKTFNGFFAFDFQASEKGFKSTVEEYAVVHLAMHGLLDNKNQILSSLVFTEDSDSLEDNFLYAYEISKMNLKADLVVLSACETGYGKFQKGNGIASLAQAFAYAGASAMIVSLWQVNDYATSEVMKNLYQNLANGMNKDEALQQAKIKYVKEAQGIAAHPAFWSPFILMGNTEAIYLKTKSGWFWWGIGIGATALIAVGLLLVRASPFWWMQRKK